MVNDFNVLFVCTGNIFRSLSAEYCLKDYITKKGIEGMNISSAGTIADKQKFQPALLNTFKGLNIDVTDHKQRKLNKQILYNQDLIIAMAKSHQDFIKEKFGISVPLFNEIAIGKKTSVKDLDEVIPKIKGPGKRWDAHIRNTVLYIHKKTPDFAQHIILDEAWLKL